MPSLYLKSATTMYPKNTPIGVWRYLLLGDKYTEIFEALSFTLLLSLTTKNEDSMKVKKSIFILIVDDDVLFTRAIQGLLEEDGHVVLCCHNGSDALELSKKQNFDVILIDYHVPGMKGDVVCRLLRHHHPDIFIIGYSSELQDKAFLSAGADTFIRKDQLVQNLSFLMQSKTTRLIE